MASEKITNLTEATSIDQDNDYFVMVDVSDTTQAASGTNKKIKPANLNLGSYIYDVTSSTYGAKGDAIDLTDGAITASDATLTSASATFTSADVGKVVAVKGAGASGAYLVTTIATFTDANTVELTVNASTTVSGATFFYGTDDTSAIQSAIQAAFDATGGIVFIPVGIYILNGSLQNDIGPDLIDYNSQLYIPENNFDEIERRSISIVGEQVNNLNNSGGIGNSISPNTGTILRSTIQGSGTRPSVICNLGASTNFESFSYTNVFCSNFGIQLLPDANNKLTMGGLNFKYSAIANVEYFTAYPFGINLVDSGQPDVIDVVGVAMPKHNCEHINTIKNSTVGGFTHGYLAGEHNSFYDTHAVCCTNGFTQERNEHTNTFTRIGSHWCINDFNVIDDSRIEVLLLQIEWINTGKWYDNDYLIKDTSSQGDGFINYNIVAAGVGIDNTKFAKSGGEKLQTRPVSLLDIFNTETGTTYTFNIYDAYRITEGTSSSNAIFTIPNSSTVNYDIGAKLVLQRNGTGELEFGAAAGVTINTSKSNKLRTQYSEAFARKIATNVWQLEGDLKTTPQLESATITNANKNQIVMVFNEVVTGTNLGFTIAGTTSTTFSSISGSGTNTITGTMANDAASGETITLSYSQSTGDFVNNSNQPLEDITAFAVSNLISGDYALTDRVAAWKFQGNSNDSIGTINGTDTSVSYSAGLIGNCADFTAGNTSKIDFGDDNLLSFGDGSTDSPFSWTTNVNWTTVGSSMFINKRGSTTNEEYHVFFFGNEIYFTVFDASASSYIGVKCSFTPSTSTWYNIGVSYSGSGSSTGMKIYIDGTAQSTTDNSSGTYTAMENTTSPLVFGKESYSNSFAINGYMDDTVLYDAELTATQFSDIATAQLAGTNIID